MNAIKRIVLKILSVLPTGKYIVFESVPDLSDNPKPVFDRMLEMKLDKKYKDNPDRIFEAGETSKGNKGTGLGLWIMREVVNKNNGTIHVMSKEDGFGIKINIPIN